VKVDEGALLTHRVERKNRADPFGHGESRITPGRDGALSPSGRSTRPLWPWYWNVSMLPIVDAGLVVAPEVAERDVSVTWLPLPSGDLVVDDGRLAGGLELRGAGSGRT
jgi:hypothetical protein